MNQDTLDTFAQPSFDEPVSPLFESATPVMLRDESKNSTGSKPIRYESKNSTDSTNIAEDTTSVTSSHQTQQSGFSALRKQISISSLTMKEDAGLFRSKPHRLPPIVSWFLCITVAASLAIVNVTMVLADAFLVTWKFEMAQVLVLSEGVGIATLLLAGSAFILVGGATTLVLCFARSAAGSGLPEIKGYMNGNSIKGFFGLRRILVRVVAIVMVVGSGFPVGREGPMVSIGGGVGEWLASKFAAPYFRKMVRTGGGGQQSKVVDEERFSHAKRIGCALGGAAGIAAAFNAPIGGLLYMFEEVTVTSWPPELTFQMFICTVCAALASKALFTFSGINIGALTFLDTSSEEESHRRLAGGAVGGSQAWEWKDLPFFAILGVLGGVWAALLTKNLLKWWHLRNVSAWFANYRKRPVMKGLETTLYAVICASVFAIIPSYFGSCQDLPQHHELERQRSFTRYVCDEHEFNGVATLTLSGAEGAVMHLFSRDWHSATYLPVAELLICLAIYAPLAAGVAGLSVPMGAFIPCMYMGGLIGRIFGVSLKSGVAGLGPAGVYAIMGSAAVLAGFTHMTLAITVLLLEVTQDLSLIGPLMLCISIARVVSQAINHHGYDEQLILLKKVPFLDEDPPKILDDLVAGDLCEELHPDTFLRCEMPKPQVQLALKVTPEQEHFPVMSSCGTVCEGIIPRARLETIMGVRTWIRRMSNSFAPDTDLTATPRTPNSIGDFEAEERFSPKRGPLLAVQGLMDQTPHTAFEDMPISRLYSLFTRLGVTAICVVHRDGTFKGIITRQELMHAAGPKKWDQHQGWGKGLNEKLAASEEKNRVLMEEAKAFMAEIEALRKQLNAAEERQTVKVEVPLSHCGQQLPAMNLAVTFEPSNDAKQPANRLVTLI